jgi:hypothetical protein
MVPVMYMMEPSFVGRDGWKCTRRPPKLRFATYWFVSSRNAKVRSEKYASLDAEP